MALRIERSQAALGAFCEFGIAARITGCFVGCAAGVRALGADALATAWTAVFRAAIVKFVPASTVARFDWFGHAIAVICGDFFRERAAVSV